MQVKPRVMEWGSWALVWGRIMNRTEAFCFGIENWKEGMCRHSALPFTIPN